VASRRLADIWREETRRRRKDTVAASEPTVAAAVSDRDDSLALLFMSCHPALTPTDAIPLTLRAVGGLSTAEIAHAFMVPDATMAKRISRAKLQIKSSELPLRMPTQAELGHGWVRCYTCST
jgi:predicted RNA polymerase sigma factor